MSSASIWDSVEVMCWSKRLLWEEYINVHKERKVVATALNEEQYKSFYNIMDYIYEIDCME